MTRILAGVAFELVGSLDVERLASGVPSEYSHRLPSGTKPNRHGSGPFCRFALRSSGMTDGVYVLFLDENLSYVGECTDLGRRFGEAGYGYITARHCHSDGQATDCKINSRILIAAKAGKAVSVWFHGTSHRKSVEARLISELNPPWNGIRPDAPLAKSRSSQTPRSSPKGPGRAS